MGRAGEWEGPDAVAEPPPLKPRIWFKAGQWGQLFVGEFLGVFWIVLIIGVTIAAGNPFTAIFVGCMYLTAQVYSHIGTSGSCINPSISMCVALCRKDILPMKQLWKYQISEFAGAFTAWLLLGGVFYPSEGGAFYDAENPGFALWENVGLKPPATIPDDELTSWWIKAMLIEFLGGTLFLEVIANCALTKKDGPNQYYAMAIGFVLTPCIYFMIPISGGCINPSIGFAINFFHAVQTGENVGGIFAFTLIGYTASFGAALIFSLGRADEFEDEKEGPLLFRFKAGQWGKLFVGEFLGVYWIVLTIGIGIMSYEAPWSYLLPLMVGLYLTAQVYSHLGTSGSCINPAISLCVHLCRPDVIPGNQLWKYQIMEYLGAFSGWLTVAIFYEDVWELVQLKPNEETFFWGHAFLIEAMMTAMFLSHIANNALSPKDSPNQYYALAIGGSLAAGVVVMAPISGACINPSIANAINLLYLLTGCKAGDGCTGSDVGYWICYILATYTGGVVASILFSMGRAGEFVAPAAPPAKVDSLRE
jgi:glycerol uptake facilitator-like aquaporin